MRLIESASKRELGRRGVTVPPGSVAETVDAARLAASEHGGDVAVKALVPANRRAVSGGVRFATGEAEAMAAAGELLGTSLAGFAVRSVLVEQRVQTRRELYFATVLDTEIGAPVASAGLTGGIDVEDAFDTLVTTVLDVNPRVAGNRLHELWRRAGLEGRDLAAVAQASELLVDAFFALDATLVEVNPLALTGEGETTRAVAVGAVVALDAAGASRRAIPFAEGELHPERWRDATELEREAEVVAECDPYRGTARFIQLGGDIGLVTGGGGASLVLFDAVQRAGGSPACYTEIGGNPTAEKVRGLTRVVLSCPGVRGLLVAHNITNNTQIDLIAEGVVAALADCDIDPASFPVCAREVGTNDAAGAELFERAGIEWLDENVTLEHAAQRIVDRITQMGRSR